jgi:tetratricopeptide (TPR) repeat protein
MDEKDASSNKKYNITGQAGDWVDLSTVYRHEHRYNDALDAIGRYRVVDELAAKVKFSDPKEETLLHWFSQNELLEIYREKGDLVAAKPLFERSMEMLKTISLGKRDPRIAELQSNHAAFLGDEGKLDEAESVYKVALDTWTNRYRYSWDPEQMELEHAEALANYATLLRKLNRPVEAEPLEAQAAATYASSSVIRASSVSPVVSSTLVAFSFPSTLGISRAMPTDDLLDQFFAESSGERTRAQ